MLNTLRVKDTLRRLGFRVNPAGKYIDISLPSITVRSILNGFDLNGVDGADSVVKHEFDKISGRFGDGMKLSLLGYNVDPARKTIDMRVKAMDNGTRKFYAPSNTRKFYAPSDTRKFYTPSIKRIPSENIKRLENRGYTIYIDDDGEYRKNPLYKLDLPSSEVGKVIDAYRAGGLKRFDNKIREIASSLSRELNYATLLGCDIPASGNRVSIIFSTKRPDRNGFRERGRIAAGYRTTILKRIAQDAEKEEKGEKMGIEKGKVTVDEDKGKIKINLVTKKSMLRRGQEETEKTEKTEETEETEETYPVEGEISVDTEKGTVTVDVDIKEEGMPGQVKRPKIRERPERPEIEERPERPEIEERPERPEIEERPERPERPEIERMPLPESKVESLRRLEREIRKESFRDKLRSYSRLHRKGAYDPILDTDLKPKFGPEAIHAHEKVDIKPSDEPIQAREKREPVPIQKPQIADERETPGGKIKPGYDITGSKAVRAYKIVDKLVEKNLIKGDKDSMNKEYRYLLGRTNEQLNEFEKIVNKVADENVVVDSGEVFDIDSVFEE